MASSLKSDQLKAALVVIDVQIGIARHENIHAGWPGILSNIAALVSRSHAGGLPVIFVQHDGGPGHPLEPGTGGWALCPELAMGDTDLLVRKTACDAFFGTNLESILRERGVQYLVVAGCMTEYCVDTTVRRAASLGFDVILAGDAHGTLNSPSLRAEQIIEHHNNLLEGFTAGGASVAVKPSSTVSFS